jgi:hypothetical protein
MKSSVFACRGDGQPIGAAAGRSGGRITGDGPISAAIARSAGVVGEFVIAFRSGGLKVALGILM